MSQLYFFSLRDVRDKGISKFSGLIPKLFDDLYNNESINVNDVFNYDDVEKTSQKNVFKTIYFCYSFRFFFGGYYCLYLFFIFCWR